MSITLVPKRKFKTGTPSDKTLITNVLARVENVVETRYIGTIDNTPVDGVTTSSISSNWAYDHAAAASQIGSYTGNATEVRAIAHGLGVVPKAVLIWGGTSLQWSYGKTGTLTGFFYSRPQTTPLSGFAAVTGGTPDATNFYVGNAADYDSSANANAQTYYWVAIG